MICLPVPQILPLFGSWRLFKLHSTATQNNFQLDTIDSIYNCRRDGENHFVAYPDLLAKLLENQTRKVN